MNNLRCADALDALLSTDLPVSASGVPVELRAHLRTCERCQAVAASLQNQTAALAALTQSVPLQSRAVVGRTATRTPRLAMLAAAAIAVFVLWPDARLPDTEAVTESVTAGTDDAVTESVREIASQADAQVSTQIVAEPPAAAVSATEPTRPRATGRSVALSGAADDRQTRELGTPIATPKRLEAVPLFAAAVPVDLTVDSALDAFESSRTDRLRNNPVLLPQSNPHITVYWVF